jgi:hypothetical protein
MTSSRPTASGVGLAEKASLADNGWVLGGASATSLAVGASPDNWARYAAHWDALVLDTYMRDGGTYRYRRFGHYQVDGASLTRLPHSVYRQETSVNPLNGGVDRSFEPLTAAFADDPLTHAIVHLLADIVSAVEGNVVWDVKLHPFRIVTSPEQTGRPAPQGRHRDGCMYVTSLLIRRVNIDGGTSSVYDSEQRQVMSAALTDPGDYLLIDDRRLMHDVTDIHPQDAGRPAYRDVLIVDFDRISDHE